jgi:acylaminoacyl-peptidase
MGKDFLFFLSKKQEDSEYQLFKVKFSGGTALQVTDFSHSIEQVYPVRDTNKVFFKTRETKEIPKKPYEKYPKVRHVYRINHKADGFGFYPTDGSYQLFSYDADSGSTENVYTSDNDFTLADVAPDGVRVALIKDNKPENDLDYGHGVYVLNTVTNQLENITSLHPEWVFSHAKFSPNGTQMLLVGRSARYDANTEFKVYGYNFSNRKFYGYIDDMDEEVADFLFTDFTQHLSGEDAFWIDDDRFVFRTASHGRTKMFIFQDGKAIPFFDEAERITDWSVVGKKLVVTYSTGTRPVILASLDLDGHQKELFNPNKVFDDEHQYVKPERFIYKASDGLAIEGWLMEPIEPQEKNPLVLYIHGGPHFAYGENFFFEMQVHAANGYGVVLLNPRGSKTYGQTFCQENVGHYGEKDFSDLMEGMDYVLAHHPEFDKNQQFCAGGSYGGYMTTWVVGHTDRFSAAVAQRPVTDWISFSGTSDIGFMFTPQELKTNRYDVATLWKFSPLAYAKNVKTPTLIMQGEWDTRTPIGQGEEFFSALVENGVEAEMARYPQSWHGVSRNGLPNLRVERIKETRRWWDKHQ